MSERGLLDVCIVKGLDLYDEDSHQKALGASQDLLGGPQFQTRPVANRDSD